MKSFLTAFAIVLATLASVDAHAASPSQRANVKNKMALVKQKFSQMKSQLGNSSMIRFVEKANDRAVRADERLATFDFYDADCWDFGTNCGAAGDALRIFNASIRGAIAAARTLHRRNSSIGVLDYDLTLDALEQLEDIQDLASQF